MDVAVGGPLGLAGGSREQEEGELIMPVWIVDSGRTIGYKKSGVGVKVNGACCEVGVAPATGRGVDDGSTRVGTSATGVRAYGGSQLPSDGAMVQFAHNGSSPRI